MSKTPGIGSSREDRPTSEYTPPAASGSPYGTVVQETVLNPEGRRLSAIAESSFETGFAGGEVTPVDSQLWRKLFPVDADQPGVVDFDAPAGCELGHFTVEERIGSGGMGAVFRALDQRLQRVVALKVLSPSQSRDRASVLRFQNEARSAARLDHENVARVYYVGEDRGLNFIAFEYVTGQNVRDLITRTGRISVADAINYTLQIAAALRHTAAAGVVHRDIKPSNIIIAPNGRAKLVDLGLARKLAPDGAGDLTVAGTTLGTFDYISPEQARDPRSVDVRSDIYSLGCTLYHMLTGGPPYSSGTVLQKLLDHQSGQAPDPRSANPQVPPALSALCRRMMAGDPKNRPSTPDDLIRELAVIAAGLGLRPMPPEGFVWSRPAVVASPKIRSGLIWAGSAVVVLLLALLVDRPNSAEDPAALAPDAALSNDATSTTATSVPAQGEGGDDAELARSGRSTPPPLPQYEPDTATPSEKLAATSSNDPRGSSSSSGAVSSPAVAQSATGNGQAAADSTGRGSAIDPDRSTFAEDSSAEPTSAWLASWLRDLQSLDEMVGNAPSSPLTTEEDPSEPIEVESSPRNTLPAEPRLAADTSLAPPPYGQPGLPFVLRPANDAGEINEYKTLAEAVAMAGPGARIELHYNGVLPGAGSVEPLTVDGKNITISAGVDEQQQPYRPVLEFTADPALSRRSQMIRVSGQGGGLGLKGIELRMTVTGEARSNSGQWSLFSLFETQQIQLVDVGITIVNAKAWPGVSVFDLRTPEGLTAQASEMNPFMDDGRANGFTIELQDCFVRGGADFITVAHTRPGRVMLRDSAFALQSALLNVTGSLELPLAGDAITLQMEHVTAVVGDALLRFEVGTLPYYATKVQATVRDSVLASSSAGPLVVMTGNATPATFLDMLEWNGNNNVFDRFSEYWSILTDEGSSDLAPHRFELWQKRWQQYASSGGNSIAEKAISPLDSFATIWRNASEAKKPSTHETTAGDLELDPRPGEIDLTATDALDRGFALRSGLIGAPVRELPAFFNSSFGLSSNGSALPR